MSDDLIVVVPRGTRVRYIESDAVDKVLLLDATVLEAKVPIVPPPLGALGPLFSTPVFDARPFNMIVDVA